MNGSETIYKRANDIVRGMTLREKAGLCSGRGYWHTKAVKRLNLPSVMLSDGPHGLRRQGAVGNRFGIGGSAPATCFPTASGLACSFDRELLKEVGAALAEEAAAQGVSVLLGPGVNIKRSPLCGRNFEYFSEDPFVSGELGVAFTRGVQDGTGIGACLKHFAANNQEKNRMVSDSVISERTLRGIYLPAFEKVVKEARPAALMCSYNKLNGIYASENRRLLTELLRGEWGYEGLAVSDWGATADRVRGLLAGLDLEMPGSGGYNTRQIMLAVKSGVLPESVLDESVTRVVRLVLESAEQGAVQNSCRGGESSDTMYERHHELARRAAAESAVLLKNERGVLPLAAGRKIAVIGEFARKPRYQGAGSSLVNPKRLECLWDEIIRDFPDAVYARGYSLSKGERARDGLISEAVSAASAADTVLLITGLPPEYESEGYDRISLAMPKNHETLIRAVCAANPNTAVIIQAGAPVDLSPCGKAAAILFAYLGGEAGGGAICDILTGRVNPSGKLAETFPLSIEDTPCYGNFSTDSRRVEYREGLFVGYRHYETRGLTVAYPFGYGLSYTSFEYSGESELISENGARRMCVTVTNTGERAGAEIVMFFAEPDTYPDTDNEAEAPLRELIAFEKIYLEAGESADVTADIPRAGRQKASAGALPLTEEAAPGTKEFAQNLPESPHRLSGAERYDANSTLSDIRHNPVGMILYAIVRLALTFVYGTEELGRRTTEAIIGETPLRTMSTMSGNLLPRPLINAILSASKMPRRSDTK